MILIEKMLNTILIIIVSFFFTGIIDRTKNKLAGRKGSPILQPVKELYRLLRKGSVFSETTSFIFRIAPSLYLATTLTAVLMIPFGNSGGLISFNGDFILFAYILGLGKFFNIISALDTGSSFEGMGASREALFSMITEPAFFILMGSMSLLSGQTSFQHIYNLLYHFYNLSPVFVTTLITLGSLILFMLLLIENSRMPVDDPKTHLELTMIHEVMILDNSGFDLGLILYSGFLKFAIYGSIIANLFMTTNNSIVQNLLIFFGVQFVCAITVGLVETFLARFRINQNPQIIFSVSSIALLIFIGVMILIGKFN